MLTRRSVGNGSFLSLAVLTSVLVSSLIGPSVRADDGAARSVEPDRQAKQRVNDNYGRLSLSFEKNEGQTDPRVEYLSRGLGYTLFLSNGGEAVLALSSSGTPMRGADPRSSVLPAIMAQGQAQAHAAGASLRLKLVNGNKKARAEGREELPGTVNYLRGTDRTQWRTGISTFARVAYENVYPGVDLVYYGNQRQLEYDFIVSPGADPARIVLHLEGADRIEIDDRGDLLLYVPGGMIRKARPSIYQLADGRRQRVSGGYVLQGRSEVRFVVGAYDTNEPLVIDPTLVYSTLLGGSSNDVPAPLDGIAVDASGSAYVTGYTLSATFPTTSGSFDETSNSNYDVFVAKLDSAGSTLLYSTYLGGSSGDFTNGLVVDASGSAYLTGLTDSLDFPTTLGAFDTTFNGGFDAFVTKLDAAGDALGYSTYLGGNGFDQGLGGIAVDAVGIAYVTGYTSSANFPTTAGGFDTSFNGGNDVFVSKLNAAGTALTYSTYLGGSDSELPVGIATDTPGNVVVVGHTFSTDFPTTPGAFDTSLDGATDAFVTKLDTGGSIPLVYSTYLGGANGDQAYGGVALDGSGNAYVAGYTDSVDFPTTPGAFDTSFNGGSEDAFVTKLNADGSALVYSTYLGGSDGEVANSITLDTTDSAYVTGTTNSLDFPTTPGALDPTFNGNGDVFVTKLNAAGSAPLVYSTYLGGANHDQGYGIVLDPVGSIYVTGWTFSADFPTTPGAFDPTFNGNQDVFVLKIDVADVPSNSQPTLAVDLPSVTVNEGLTATNTGSYSDQNSSDDVTISASVGNVTKTGTNSGTWSWSFAATDGTSQTQTVTITANDGNGGISTATFSLIVNNVAPVITGVSGPAGPLALGTPATVSADFTDVGTLDTHTCTFSWDDGTSTPPSLPAATVSETDGSGSCSATHTYAAAGVYTVNVTVKDKDNAVTTSSFEFVVVYDPSAWFVTGGGRIASPAGAYTPNPGLAGNATFGFVSRYQKGASTPTGNTEFQFHAASFNFQSGNYEWLVVAGHKAQYKGTGTINGSGSYSFMLTATDGQLPGGGGVDKLRMKIWSGGGVIYDNVGGSDDIDTVVPQAISSGSIVIHQ